MALLAKYVGRGNIQVRPSSKQFKRAYSTVNFEELGITNTGTHMIHRKDKSALDF